MPSFRATPSRFPLGKTSSCSLSLKRVAAPLILLWLLSLGAWAQKEARVAVPLAAVHRAPSSASERVTEALLWDRVLIIQESGPWAKVVVADQYRRPEGYPGWMLRRHLASGTSRRLGPVVGVRVAVTDLFEAAEPSAPVVQRVYLGTRLPLHSPESEPENGYLAVRFPGIAEPLYVLASRVERERPTDKGAEVLKTARQLEGTPYLWGGMSVRGVDCSGLVYTAFRLHGFTLPRDADQQAQVGQLLSVDELEAGDLVFFGPTSDDVTHVGIYVGNGDFLHASSSWGVSTTTLLEGHYHQRFLWGRRVLRPATDPQVEVPRS